MRWENLYVAGLGTYLPEHLETAEEAITDGRYDARAHAINGCRAVRVADEGLTGPMMAAIAGRRAVARSGHDHDEFGLVLHSYIAHQGLDLWAPASYVQNETIGGLAPAFEIRQGCNGGLAALEMAASYVTARPSVTAALITGGDAFRLPYINRWTSDNANVYADGAAALVLSSRKGFLGLRSTVSQGDPALEPMERGTSGFHDAPFHDGKPVCTAARKREYLMSLDDAYDTVIERCADGIGRTLKRALRDAGTDMDGVAYFLHQTLSESLATFVLHGEVGVDPARTTYEWGRGQGMVGTADLFVGLNHLVETNRLEPGDLVALMGLGAGSVWSAAVLEFLHAPSGDGDGDVDG